MSYRAWETLKAVPLAAVLLAATTAAGMAVTVGPVTDPIGVVKIPKGAPLQIGGYWVMSGPDSALGIDEKRAVEIAIKDVGGKLVGHPIKFSAEDDGCNPEGGQTAATKLAANPQNVIIIGPACSSAATPAAPILWKAGMVDIDTAATAPALTAADRKPEYDGFVRTVYSDTDQGASDAKYIYNVLKARKVVTLHDGSAYAQQLAHVMAENFKKLGGTILSQEAVAPTDVDMHPVLTRVATEKPDVLYFPIFVAAASQILRQAKEIPGMAHVQLIGSSGLMAPDLIEAARDAVVGFRITYPDQSPEAMGKGYPAFVEKYTKMFGEAPISGYHANAYDAAMLAFKAIEKVAKTDKSGTTYIGRKALRDAVYATKFEGISGPIACDAHGECAKFKPAVYEFTNADPKTFKIGVNPKKIWP
ncbi:MAG TPA: branched-chain amino acid ABC transporter substrate-binding protein [Alphaproteobacteria bacterium]|nr:branched-chain amino acid ABC transporter substrate-binding protein [Alphaproteobacteria bacterium]